MINKVEFDGFKYIEGGVCAAQGFKANGIHCGLAHKPLGDTEKNSMVSNNALPVGKKNDLAVIIADRQCSAAAVYTSNKVKGAPIGVTKNNIADGKARGVIVNSVNANTCNADGVEKAQKMCELVSKEFGFEPSDFIVASTGVIGQVLPIEPIEKAMPELCKGVDYDGNAAAVEAIMTTDTVPKEIAVEFELGGKKCVIGGMLKGSGMIHPNMATTLSFITTDIAIAPEYLQRALSDVVKVTLNMVSVDGDQSTNDMCCVMANGMAENELIQSECDDFSAFEDALYVVMMNLARMMARDGEGATKLIECVCAGADSFETAKSVAKSVIMSSLFKAAVFGEDANWGRILCAVGYADAEFDINCVDVDITSDAGTIAVCRNGAGVEFSEEEAKKILSEEEITVLITIGGGEYNAVAWGCDLTYDYVKINGDYRS
ncbi:MAG: bifunctional ornithine acetyltransferase/N-acetylglutamate synthase [Clostridium sp.]|nr:bifunctional ornithine acetyltransferase/N-acetylglutamate synthase [Clostridium sp.]MCM1547898.1 bifunctional ornithine acetyltransferase/N-acetylglutamate synthase [Ruminococcus sp.]